MLQAYMWLRSAIGTRGICLLIISGILILSLGDKLPIIIIFLILTTKNYIAYADFSGGIGVVLNSTLCTTLVRFYEIGYIAGSNEVNGVAGVVIVTSYIFLLSVIHFYGLALSNFFVFSYTYSSIGLGILISTVIWCVFSLINIFIANLIIFLLLTLIIATITLIERKVLALVQRRVGPNYIGYRGRLQFIADALKLLLKHIIVMPKTNRLLFLLIPALILVICYLF